jgi:hypothetical protein
MTVRRRNYVVNPALRRISIEGRREMGGPPSPTDCRSSLSDGTGCHQVRSAEIGLEARGRANREGGPIRSLV